MTVLHTKNEICSHDVSIILRSHYLWGEKKHKMFSYKKLKHDNYLRLAMWA